MFPPPLGYSLAVFVCQSLAAPEPDEAEREPVALTPLVRHAMHTILVEEIVAVIVQFGNRRFTSSEGMEPL